MHLLCVIARFHDFFPLVIPLPLIYTPAHIAAGVTLTMLPNAVILALYLQNIKACYLSRSYKPQSPFSILQFLPLEPLLIVSVCVATVASARGLAKLATFLHITWKKVVARMRHNFYSNAWRHAFERCPPLHSVVAGCPY